ncbi:MAG: hypothetical protein ABR905_07660 [Terracidiphilus sp.]|jgi:hypothetical protein
MTTDSQRTLSAYLDAVAVWNLDDTAAANLIGAPSETAHEWQDGQSAEPSEEVLARMMMVAQIRTALDICYSTPLSNEWISLPNGGEPYRGLSPVAYVVQHGWPGLYWVLRQVQAWAVGNH